MSNPAIADQVGLSRRLFGLWDVAGPSPEPESFRSNPSRPAPSCKGHRAILRDLPRPVSPGKFTPEQVTLTSAVACEPPEKSGRPLTHWTAHELADEVVKRGIVASISPAQVGRYLREAALQPHKSRSWLNTTEKDPRCFQEQVEAICDTYQLRPRWRRSTTRTRSASTR